MLFPLHWIQLGYYNSICEVTILRKNSLCVLEKLCKLRWIVIDVVKHRINKYWKNVSIILWKIWKSHSMYWVLPASRAAYIGHNILPKKDRLSFENKTASWTFFLPSSNWLNKGLHCQEPRLIVYAVHLQTEKMKRILWQLQVNYQQPRPLFNKILPSDTTHRQNST